MKPLSLEEIEAHPDTDAMTKALSGADSDIEWTRLFSAYGKHNINVRKDPNESE